jgi:hypothetical protein
VTKLKDHDRYLEKRRSVIKQALPFFVKIYFCSIEGLHTAGKIANVYVKNSSLKACAWTNNTSKTRKVIRFHRPIYFRVFTGLFVHIRNARTTGENLNVFFVKQVATEYLNNSVTAVITTHETSF